MNQVFSNCLTAQLPSYDPGGVIRFDSGDWSFSGVYMTPKTNAGKTYDYYAAQIRLRRQSRLGIGHYNLFAIAGSRLDGVSYMTHIGGLICGYIYLTRYHRTPDIQRWRYMR